MKRIRLMSLVLMMCLLISACGPVNNSNPPTTSTSSSESTGSSTKRDTLNLSVNMPLNTLDPHKTRWLQDLFVYSQIFDGLYALNYNTRELEPRVAESHSISEDGKTYTFNLRKDVKFHNGDSLTAEDVVFSLERALDFPATANFLPSVKSITKVDDYTVEINLENPNAAFMVCVSEVDLLNKREVLELGDEFGTKIHGAACGPYMVTYLDNDVEWKLEAFSDYYRGEAPIKYVNYKPIVDASSGLLAFESGEIDWYTAPIANWDDLSSNPEFNSELYPANHISYIAINYEANEVLANDNVRKAIAYAIDKEAMNKASFNGFGFIADCMVNPMYNIGTPEDSFKYEYNPEKAKELLTEAGYPDGVYVGKILAFTGSYYEKMALVLQANLDAIGIKADLEFVEQSAALSRGRNQDYDITVTGTGNQGDFDFFRLMAHSDSKGSYFVKFEGDKFNWKRFDELFALSAAEQDPDKRVAINKELHDSVMDTATLLPVLHKVQPYVWNKDLNCVNSPDFYEVYNWSWK